MTWRFGEKVGILICVKERRQEESNCFWNPNAIEATKIHNNDFYFCSSSIQAYNKKNKKKKLLLLSTINPGPYGSDIPMSTSLVNIDCVEIQKKMLQIKIKNLSRHLQEKNYNHFHKINFSGRPWSLKYAAEILGFKNTMRKQFSIGTEIRKKILHHISTLLCCKRSCS